MGCFPLFIFRFFCDNVTLMRMLQDMCTHRKTKLQYDSLNLHFNYKCTARTLTKPMGQAFVFNSVGETCIS